MLQIPDEIKELFRSDNNSTNTAKHVKLRFYENNVPMLYPDNFLYPSNDLFPMEQEPFLTIENNQILEESLTIVEYLCSEDDVIFGECDSTRVEVVVADVSLNLTGKEFLLTIEVGGYELSMGIFRVESFVRQSDRRMKKIIAYDRMRNFVCDTAGWYNGLKFPMSLRQLRDSLCEYIGIEQTMMNLPLDNLEIKKTIEPQQLSGLDVLQKICELNGCFGHIDNTGRLKYITLGISSLYPDNDLYPSEELYPAEMTNAETVSHYIPAGTNYEDYIVRGIDKLQIRQEEGDVGAVFGDGENMYIAQGNFLVFGKSAVELMQIASTLFEQIKGRTYRPCQITCPAFPWVEIGDGIITHTKNDIIETYCFRRTLSGIQNMVDEYIAMGNPVREENFGLTSQITQLQGKTAVIKRSVEEVSVKVTDLKEYTESQFKITAEQIIAEVRRAQKEEEELAASIKINADKIALKVSKGEVSSQLSIEKDKITLKGNRLIVDSTNFKLDGNGNATFSGDVRGADIYGSNINGGYIYGATIESNIMNVNPSYVQIGDYRISSEKLGAFSSIDNKIQIWSDDPEWKKPIIFVGGRAGTNINDIAINTKYVNCDDVHAANCRLAQGSSRTWGLGETIDWMWEEINSRLANLNH